MNWVVPSLVFFLLQNDAWWFSPPIIVFAIFRHRKKFDPLMEDWESTSKLEGVDGEGDAVKGSRKKEKEMSRSTNKQTRIKSTALDG